LSLLSKIRKLIHWESAPKPDINLLPEVYSHFKALPQCYNYFKKHNIEEQIIVSDTAGAAIQIAETKEK